MSAKQASNPANPTISENSQPKVVKPAKTGNIAKIANPAPQAR